MSSPDTTVLELVKARLETSAQVKAEMARDPATVELLAEIAARIVASLRSGGKVLICGNGGSAADAQHIAAELVGKFYLVRAPLPAVSLTTNTSSITAVGNDFSFDDIFVKQMRGLGRPGDVAIGISTSGNSENVIRALDAAREDGLVTVAFTGKKGGRMVERVDLCLRIPSDDTPRIQEGHITAGHIVCELVEAAMFRKEPAEDDDEVTNVKKSPLEPAG
jgi:D-sedoheptulose 7-phosphate isomerase